MKLENNFCLYFQSYVPKKLNKSVSYRLEKQENHFFIKEIEVKWQKSRNIAKCHDIIKFHFI